MTEIITEDTPEDSVELLKWKLDRITAEYEKLNDLYRSQQSASYGVRASDRKHIEELQAMVRKLTSVMSVEDLRKAGMRVTVDLNLEDEEE